MCVGSWWPLMCCALVSQLRASEMEKATLQALVPSHEAEVKRSHTMVRPCVTSTALSFVLVSDSCGHTLTLQLPFLHIFLSLLALCLRTTPVMAQ